MTASIIVYSQPFFSMNHVVYWAAFCIHISICYDGTPNKLCPITSKYLRAGEPVWILNSDVSAVHRRSAVPCLSDVGVRQISLAPTPSKENLQYTSFFDPLGRQPSRKLLPNRDYTLFFVFGIFHFSNCMSFLCLKYYLRWPFFTNWALSGRAGNSRRPTNFAVRSYFWRDK